MSYSTLIEVDELVTLLSSNDIVVVDCRFNLSDTSAGESAYAVEHIPGAVYAHLGRDLSGPPVTDKGRHPMLSADAMNSLFGRLGISADTQVVAYDDMRGGVASRLWWMLRYMGHVNVAVLNGGWQAWKASGGATARGVEASRPTSYVGRPGQRRLVTIHEVSQQALLVDSRAASRYRGEEEPIDPIAGHIPNAISYPFATTFGADGRFLSSAQLKTQLTKMMGEHHSGDVAFYCGSGVTACANLLAVAHAGLENSGLYGGSWSEWCREKPDCIG